MIFNPELMYEQPSKAKDDIARIVRKKLEGISYLPVYATSEIESKLRSLQEEDLALRKSKRFTLDRGVEMLKEIDELQDELTKAKKEYIEQKEKMKYVSGTIEEMARKKKIKRSPKRKIIKRKLIKRKK